MADNKAAPILASFDAAEQRWPLSLPLVLLALLWGAMTWPWLSGRVTVPWDAKAQFLPQIQFLAQSVARGESPFWAPYVFSGQNQIADPQSMMFAPPFLLLAAFDGNPSPWAVDLTTLLAGLFGAAALVVWFRDRGWHWAGALVAGVCFAFGASMSWRMQHIEQVVSLAYWPMAMLALDRMLERRRIGYALALGTLGAAVLVGRNQVSLLVLYALVAQALWRVLGPEDRWLRVRQAMPLLSCAGALAIGLAAIPLVLTALHAEMSNRPSFDFESAGRGSLHPALLITTLIPQLFGAAFRMEDYWGPPSFAWPDTGLYIAQNMGQLYIGLIPLALLAFAASRRQLWAPEIRFFTIALGVTLLYALGWYTPAFHIMYDVLPGVARFRRPADAAFMIGGLMAILAGYAAHRLFERPWEGIPRVAIQLTIGIAVTAVVAAFGLAIHIERLALLRYPLAAAAIAAAGSALAIALVLPRRALEPWTAALILAGATTVDLAYNNGPSSSSAMPPAYYDVFDPATQNPVIRTLEAHVEADRTPTRRDRIELLGLGFHWPNASLTHRLENTLGYNPVRLKLYVDATGARDNIGSPEERRFTPLLPSYKSLLVDMLGLRYVAAGVPLEKIDPSLKPGDWPLIATYPGAWIYENPRALPRLSFVTRSEEADFSQILTSGRWPNFDVTNTVLVEPGHAGNYAAGAPIKIGDAPAVALTNYTNTKVDITTNAATAGFVVLNDLWHPWWFAEIDGKPAKMLRANVLFRAVQVPAGPHTVRFVFRPLRGAWQQLRHELE